MLLKALVALAAISAALAFAAPPALACTCMPFTKPDYARQATLVFTGTVTGVDVRGGPLVRPSMVDVVFDVDKVYKGTPTKSHDLHRLGAPAAATSSNRAADTVSASRRIQSHGPLQCNVAGDRSAGVPARVGLSAR